ncbi:MAG: CsiV family protein [Gammaproteobacteria bacterium]|nr:CsiV family protein [Gammaproteobacteria bacterium]
MHHRPLLPLLLGLACAFTLPAQAQEENKRRYDVEIVILENTDISAGERERWQARVTVPEVEGAIAFEPRSELARMARRERLAETPEGFEPLPPEQLKLGGAIQKLEESEQFRVLRHIAWRQPAVDREQSLPVRAYHGEPVTVRVPITDFEELYAMEQMAAELAAAEAEEAEEGEADGEMAESVADEDATTEAEAADTAETRTSERGEFAAGTVEDAGSARTFGAGPMFQSRVRPLLRPVEIHPLDGTVRVVVSRYLHVYTNLYYTTPVQWTVMPGMGGQRRSDEEETGDQQGENTDAGAMEPAYNAPTGGAGLPSVALGPDGNAMLSYPFVQHRRMRSGELHYLDHPVIGMLIRVDRAPEQEEETDDADATTQS